MKKQTFQDERVLAQRQKIQSEGFVIVFFVLMVSAVVQSLFLNAPLEQYAVEMICFLGISAYLFIRNIALGNNVFGDRVHDKAMPLMNSLVTGIIATTIQGVLNYSKYSTHYETNVGLFIATLAIFFVSITVFVFAVISFLVYINRKNQARVQKQFDENEQDELDDE